MAAEDLSTEREATWNGELVIIPPGFIHVGRGVIKQVVDPATVPVLVVPDAEDVAPVTKSTPKTSARPSKVTRKK